MAVLVNLFVKVAWNIPVFRICPDLFLHHLQAIIKAWLIPGSPSHVADPRKVSIGNGHEVVVKFIECMV